MTAFLVGAASSGSGKSTITMALLRALCDRGMGVQPFKCGPDYIDPMYHRLACGRESVNLDTFLASPGHVRNLFARYSEGADACVVEGVMGLLDGYDRVRGSSAEVADVLGIPVVLVVNAQSVAYSVAPLLHGFRTFRPSPRLAGVVFNKVASERHLRMLYSACEDGGVPCLGYLPRHEELVIPGRHLGLTIKERTEAERLISLAASLAKEYVDIDRLLVL